jgi:hypothetical protein
MVDGKVFTITHGMKLHDWRMIAMGKYPTVNSVAMPAGMGN